MAPKTPRNRDLFLVLIITLLVGVLLVLLSEIFLIYQKPWEVILHETFSKLLFDLGMAAIIASVIGYTVERMMSQSHYDEVTSALKHIITTFKTVEKYGFRKVFPSRQEAFDELIEKAIPKAEKRMRVMGICVSLFKEAERDPRKHKESAKRIKDTIVERLLTGCAMQVLYLKRNPTDAELEKFGLTKKRDFFYMREMDEDEPRDFREGKRLKIIANSSHCSWIEILTKLADKTKKLGLDKRRKILNALQIKEYFALPSLSLYDINGDMYVTPYLYKKHCSDVPTFKVGNGLDLYKSYGNHFKAAWENASPAIPETFLDLLVKSPAETLKKYREELVEVIKRKEAEGISNTEPEYYQDEEIAVNQTILHF